MKLAIPAVIAALLAGCGADRPAPSATPAPGHAAQGASVSKASVHLSVTTHHRVEILSGLLISGSCGHGNVTVEVGHRPPYEPLRKVFNPSIDRTHPPRRVALTTTCKSGRFQITRHNASVRIGAGPLTAKGQASRQSIAVRIETIGME